MKRRLMCLALAALMTISAAGCRGSRFGTQPAVNLKQVGHQFAVLRHIKYVRMTVERKRILCTELFTGIFDRLFGLTAQYE